MILENTRFGRLAIEPAKIISMPCGMPGFPGMRRYVVLERPETWPFFYYQSVDDPQLAFVIMDPFLFEPDYAVDLGKCIAEMAWEGDRPEALRIYAIVNAAEGVPEKITANLMGPLIVNPARCEACQMVLHKSPYSHRHPVFGKSTAYRVPDAAARGRTKRTPA